MNTNKKGLTAKFKMSSMAWIITIIATAVVVFLNLLTSALSSRYNLELDLTPESVFRLTSDTTDYLKSLDKDIKIIIMADENLYTNTGNAYYIQAETVIKQYAKLSNHISIEYVDITSNPTYVTSHYPRLSGLNIFQGDIVVDSGEKQTLVSSSSLFDIQTSQTTGQQTMSSKAEQAMTSAIMKSLSEETVHVSIIGDVDGPTLSNLTNLFNSNNYDVDTKSIITDNLDKETSIAVLIPMRDLSNDEINKLDVFLDNGGQLGKTLVYFTPNQQPQTPNLDAFLQDWGISIDRALIAEQDPSKLYRNNSLYEYIASYIENDYTVDVIDKASMVATPYARPVNLLYDKSGNRKTAALLGSSSQAVSISMEDLANENENIVPQQQGPFNIFALSEKTVSLGSTIGASRILVSGSAYMIQDLGNESYLSLASFKNSDYFIGLINTLYNNDVGIYVSPKSLESAPLIISNAQAYTFMILLIGVIPMFLMIFGFVFWLKRRHL